MGNKQRTEKAQALLEIQMKLNKKEEDKKEEVNEARLEVETVKKALDTIKEQEQKVEKEIETSEKQQQEKEKEKEKAKSALEKVEEVGRTLPELERELKN